MYITKYFITHKLPSGRNILVNTLTGSVDFVPSHVIGQMEKGKFTETDGLEEIMLRKKGYLFDSPGEERKQIDAFYRKEEEESGQKPYVFVFCLTYACNLRCFYCFEDDYHQTESVLTEDDMDKITGFMERLIGEKPDRPFRVVLEGGEPFLEHREEILEDFFKKMNGLAARYRGFCGVTVFTNGENTLSYLEMMKRYAGIIERVLITLAGPAKVHNLYRVSVSGKGNYEKAVTATSVLQENGIRVHTVLNLDKNNIHCLPEISDELHRCGWNEKENYLGCYVSSIKYFDSKYAGDALSEYAVWKAILDFAGRGELDEGLFHLGDMKYLKSVDRLIRCGRPRFHNCAAADGKQYLFGPDGLIYNCTKVTANKEYSVGGYRGEAGAELEEEKVKWWKTGTGQGSGSCGDCRYAFICGGKCRYEEDRLGFRPEVCQGNMENLCRLYLDHLETGNCPVPQDIIYDN